VEAAAIERAERECLDDADERARARAAGAERRKQEDRVLAEQMTARIRELFPKCPPEEAVSIAAHTAARGSGRVGRTAAGRALEEEALTAAVRAAVRHNHTNYDELLAKGVSRETARAMVMERVWDTLSRWKG